MSVGALRYSTQCILKPESFITRALSPSSGESDAQKECPQRPTVGNCILKAVKSQITAPRVAAVAVVPIAGTNVSGFRMPHIIALTTIARSGPATRGIARLLASSLTGHKGGSRALVDLDEVDECGPTCLGACKPPGYICDHFCNYFCATYDDNISCNDNCLESACTVTISLGTMCRSHFGTVCVDFCIRAEQLEDD